MAKKRPQLPATLPAARGNCNRLLQQPEAPVSGKDPDKFVVRQGPILGKSPCVAEDLRAYEHSEKQPCKKYHRGRDADERLLPRSVEIPGSCGSPHPHLLPGAHLHIGKEGSHLLLPGLPGSSVKKRRQAPRPPCQLGARPVPASCRHCLHRPRSIRPPQQAQAAGDRFLCNSPR